MAWATIGVSRHGPWRRGMEVAGSSEIGVATHFLVSRHGLAFLGPRPEFGVVTRPGHGRGTGFSNTFSSEGSPIFLPTFDSVFSITTGFVLKMIIFLIHGLDKCE